MHLDTELCVAVVKVGAIFKYQYLVDKSRPVMVVETFLFHMNAALTSLTLLHFLNSPECPLLVRKALRIKVLSPSIHAGLCYSGCICVILTTALFFAYSQCCLGIFSKHSH